MQALARLYLATAVICVAFLGSMKALVGCTPPSPKTVETIKTEVVKIADDICSEESAQPDNPEWVALACAGEGIITHVLMPRPDWRAMRARRGKPPSVDSGIVGK